MQKKKIQANIRCTMDELKLIDTAASYVNRNRSNFVLYATIGRAREIINGARLDETSRKGGKKGG